MNLQLFLLFILNFTYCNSFSQDTLTDFTNARWMEEFNKIESTNEKLTAIKQKIFDDRIYGAPLKRSCLIIGDIAKSNVSKEKRYYECKILFVLKLFNKSILLDAETTETILLASRSITEKNIDSILSLSGLQSTALYGSDGRCGVVIMSSTSRKLKRRLKELKLYH